MFRYTINKNQAEPACKKRAESYMKNSKYSLKQQIKKDAEELKKDALLNAEVNELVKLIPFIEGEYYNQTARRLATALNGKVDPTVFHLAVKKIRNKI